MTASFARELGGAISCKAQNIEVKVKPNTENEILSVLNDFTVDQDGKNAIIKALDIYVGEVKHICVKMKVGKPDGKVKDRPFSVAHVEVSYDDLDTKQREKQELNVKVEFVKEEEADKVPSIAVQEQVALLTAAREQIRAAEEARKGNFDAAQAHFTRGAAVLSSAAAAGSHMAESAACYYAQDEAAFTKGGYDEHAVRCAAVGAQGVMGSRGTTGKGMNALYGTKGQAAMVSKFAGKADVDPNFAGSPKQPETLKAFEAARKHSSSFAKERKGNH